MCVRNRQPGCKYLKSQSRWSNERRSIPSIVNSSLFLRSMAEDAVPKEERRGMAPAGATAAVNIYGRRPDAGNSSPMASVDSADGHFHLWSSRGRWSPHRLHGRGTDLEVRRARRASWRWIGVGDAKAEAARASRERVQAEWQSRQSPGQHGGSMSAHLVGITMPPLGLSENGDGRSVVVDCSSGYSRHSRRFSLAAAGSREMAFSSFSRFSSSCSEPGRIWRAAGPSSVQVLEVSAKRR